MEHSDILVTKASGERVPFSSGKLRNSLERVGASDDDVAAVLTEVKHILVNGISTKKIYRSAFRLLRRRSKLVLARYALKKAIFALGPTGYPFERYVGELLKYQGFEIEVDIMIDGCHVSHEIDVLAQKENMYFLVECKFHNQPGLKNNVKIPLYVHSRFMDIKKRQQKNSDLKRQYNQGWIVTNTRFTEDAVNYANGVGLHLIGWDHPKKGSLKERIDISGLHPVTCLNTLTKTEKKIILDNGIVLCRQLYDDPKHLTEAGIKEKHQSKVLNEAAAICSGNINN